MHGSKSSTVTYGRHQCCRDWCRCDILLTCQYRWSSRTRSWRSNWRSYYWNCLVCMWINKSTYTVKYFLTSRTWNIRVFASFALAIRASVSISITSTSLSNASQFSRRRRGISAPTSFRLSFQLDYRVGCWGWWGWGGWDLPVKKFTHKYSIKLITYAVLFIGGQHYKGK